MLVKQAHQRAIAVLCRDVERCGAVLTEQVTSKPDVRRVARSAPFFSKRRLAPLDTRVWIGPVLEQLVSKLERRDVAGRNRRALRRVANTRRTIGARLAKPCDRVERRTSRV